MGLRNAGLRNGRGLAFGSSLGAVDSRNPWVVVMSVAIEGLGGSSFLTEGGGVNYEVSFGPHWLRCSETRCEAF